MWAALLYTISRAWRHKHIPFRTLRHKHIPFRKPQGNNSALAHISRHRDIYYISYILYTVHYTLYTIHYILYTIYYIPYSLLHLLSPSPHSPRAVDICMWGGAVRGARPGTRYFVYSVYIVYSI